MGMPALLSGRGYSPGARGLETAGDRRGKRPRTAPAGHHHARWQQARDWQNGQGRAVHRAGRDGPRHRPASRRVPSVWVDGSELGPGAVVGGRVLLADGRRTATLPEVTDCVIAAGAPDRAQRLRPPCRAASPGRHRPVKPADLVVSAVQAVAPVIEVDAVFAVALAFVSASAIPKACNLAPRRAAAIHSGSDLVFLGGAEGIRTPDPLHVMELRTIVRCV